MESVTGHGYRDEERRMRGDFPSLRQESDLQLLSCSIWSHWVAMDNRGTLPLRSLGENKAVHIV